MLVYLRCVGCLCAISILFFSSALCQGIGDSIRTAFLGYQEVSLIQLISTPDKFNEKKVSVRGFFHWKEEDGRLYLNKEDGDYLRLVNSISISFADTVRKGISPRSRGRIAVRPIREFDGRWVIIVGTFDRDKSNRDAGRLENATWIEELPKWYDGKARIRR
jgi:hypothetical protein